MQAAFLPKRVLWVAAMLTLSVGIRLADGQALPSPGSAPAASAESTPNPTQPASPAADPTAADAQLPGAIYKEAMHPLDVVRQSMENWSETELGALHIGMRTASEACYRMQPEDYSNGDLYDLAHLCAFGQDWNPANTAAQRYIVSKAPQHRAQAYAISVGAFVHLNALDLALETTRELLRVEPYDAEVTYTLRYMKDALESAGNPEAPVLAEEEHPLIIEALSKGTPLKAEYGDAVVSTGLLYEMAMEAAFFERYAGNDAQAATDLADVERALPPTAALTAEDRQEIDSAKLQYHLLGTQLPHIPLLRSYKSATAKARIDLDGRAATVLVLFPDWCVQCKKMMPEMSQFGATHPDTSLSAYGLIFKGDSEKATPGAQDDLLGSDVLEISADTARSFGSTDYPLGIVVDRAGFIRFIGTLPGDAFNSKGYMERVIVRIVGRQVVKPVHFVR
ncbi:MAG TPA: hypothetical protein VHW46_04605 [Terracidiphilus sp.]|nr:hypothetical protein [Terracidiphilus sp.]